MEGTALVGRPRKTWQIQVGGGGDSSCWQAEEDLAVPSWWCRGQLLLAGRGRPGSSKLVVEGQLLLAGRGRPGSSKLVVEGTALVGRPKKTWKNSVCRQASAGS